jgi:hypothetical protein
VSNKQVSQHPATTTLYSFLWGNNHSNSGFQPEKITGKDACVTNYFSDRKKLSLYNIRFIPLTLTLSHKGEREFVSNKQVSKHSAITTLCSFILENNHSNSGFQPEKVTGKDACVTNYFSDRNKLSPYNIRFIPLTLTLSRKGERDL